VHNKQVRRRRAVLGVLVAASLILLTAYFGKAPSSPLHQVQRGIVEVLSPIQEGASKVLSPVRDVAGWFSDTLRAKSQVAKYKTEVQNLQYQLALDQQDQIVNRQLTNEIHLDASDNLSGYDPVAADVYERDPTVWYQTIQVDKGSDDGVQVNDPVIGGAANGGLVGVVTVVAPTVSTVTLITDHTFAAGAEVQHAGTPYDGTIFPEEGNQNQMLLEYLAPSANIAVHDMVVTSGIKNGPLGSLYPPGIPIGVVSNANQDTLINDQQVQVTPLVNLRQITTVQVLTRPGGTTEHASIPNVTAQVGGG
jgi:rod shape-determining protein MreC